MTVTGLKQTEARLKDLEKKTTKSLGRKALRAGAKVILAAARADAPVVTGRTKKNIMIRSARSKRGSLALSVGVDYRDYTGDTFYASFVLYGHRVGSRKLGDNRKMIKANNFLQRALDSSGPAAADTIMETWQSLIETESNK